jgi:hypothetical protein
MNLVPPFAGKREVVLAAMDMETRPAASARVNSALADPPAESHYAVARAIRALDRNLLSIASLDILDLCERVRL